MTKIIGTNDNDRLVGTTLSDMIRGLEGDDVLIGLEGDDTLKGESGDDILRADQGDDLLVGGVGDDTLRGGTGNDVLRGGGGSDVLYGGAGHDVLRGGSGRDILRGGRGNDTLYGGDGNDVIFAAGGDIVDGGEGVDKVMLAFDFDKDMVEVDGTNVIIHLANGKTIDITDVEKFFFNGVKMTLADLSEAVANEAPEIDPAQTFSVAESLAAGEVIGSVVATDADGDTLSYAITGGNDAGLFEIDPASGAIILAAGAALDYEAATSHALEVTVTDPDGAADVETVDIEVTDVNDQAPIIGAAETTTGSAGNLTDTATVADAEDDFNGGTVTITADGGYFDPANFVFEPGSGFSLSGDKIIADASLLLGGTDLVIGTVDFGTLTDIDTGPGTDAQTNAITITFDKAEVYDVTVEALLRALILGDVQRPAAGGGEDTIAEVTVTVTDAAGLSDSFARVFDDSGAPMTLTNLDGDTQEVEDDGVSTTAVAIDFHGDAVLAENGAQVDGATIVVTAGVPGDTLHFDNQTGAIGAAGTMRLIGDQLAVSDGASERLIGTVTGAGTATLTITLVDVSGFDADVGDITDILDSIRADLDTSKEVHEFSTTVTDGTGYETEGAACSVTIVPDFVDATINGLLVGGGTALAPLTWAEIEAAIAADQVVQLNGNTYIELPDGAATALDLDQAASDGYLVVPAGTMVRFVSNTSGPADMRDVIGLQQLGTFAFGTAANPLTEDLRLTAAQADGAQGDGGGTAEVEVWDVQATPGVDLSGFVNGTFQAFAALIADITFSGDLGAFDLAVAGNHALSLPIAQADGRIIDHSSTNFDGNLVLTGLDGSFAGDITGVSSAQGAGHGVVINVGGNLRLHPDANLATESLEMHVADDATLTLSSVQATDITLAGGLILGEDGAFGSTGGSMVVTVADHDPMTAGVQIGDLDFTGLIPGDFDVGGYPGTATMSIDQDVTFFETGAGIDFGSVEVTVEVGATVTGDIDILLGLPLGGAGNMALTGLDGAPTADLSGVALTGTLTASTSGDVEFTGVLAGFTVTVGAGTTFVTSAAIADGHTIAGAASEADGLGGDVGGSIVITGLGTSMVDLSGLSGGAESDLGDIPGTVTVQAHGDLADGTLLPAGVVINISDSDGTAGEALELVLTEAQADGTKIVDADAVIAGSAPATIGADVGAVAIMGMAHDTDLSGVVISGDLTLHASSTVDLTGNAFADDATFCGLSVIAGDGDTDIVSTITVTMTALQANGATLEQGSVANAGLLAEDTVGFQVIANTDPSNTVAVTITGSAGDDVIGGTDVATGDILDGGDGNDALSGGGGDDLLVGGIGNDALTGGDGADSLFGDAGTDTLTGGTGTDTLTGGTGNDTLSGGGDGDILTGGVGVDNLTGGGGDDTFVFAAGDAGIGAANWDTIADFTGAGIAGGDLIDLGAGLAFNGTGALDEGTLQARYTVFGSDAVLEVDFDGDNIADAQIFLTGVTVMTAADFL